jgi:hypothetical protein
VLDPLGTGPEARPVYRVVLGAAWAGLDSRLRRFFSCSGTHTGRFSVRRGRGALARWLGRVLRLPEAGGDVPVRLVIEVHPQGERWRRELGGIELATEQRAVREGVLAERFGLLEFRFRVDGALREVRHRQVGAALVLGILRLPLPGWLAPRVAGRMWVVAGDAMPRVGVSCMAPLAGFLLAYVGRIGSGEAGP